MVKWIKLGMISLVVFFLLFTAISFLIPSDLRLAKNINIAADKASIIALTADFTKWPQWNPLLDTEDTGNWKMINNGWESKSFRITLSAVKEDEVIAGITKPGKEPIVAGWRIIEAPGLDSLAVQSYMDFHLKWFPWEKFSGLFLEKMYGGQMQNGLKKMKEMLENRSSYK